MISGFDYIKSNGLKKVFALIVDGVPTDLSAIFSETAKVEAITKEHP